MVSRVDLITAALVALAIVIFAWGFLTVRAVQAWLRQRHPEVWKRFGFPDGANGPVKANDESRVAQAERAYWRAVRNGELDKLNDARLRALLQRQKFLVRVGIAAFILLALQVLVLR